jgi:hypothetical protein
MSTRITKPKLSWEEKREIAIKAEIRRKVCSWLLSVERRAMPKGYVLSEEEVNDIDGEAKRTAEKIYPEYVAMNGAGAMWLVGMIRAADRWQVPAPGMPWTNEPKLYSYLDR